MGLSAEDLHGVASPEGITEMFRASRRWREKGDPEAASALMAKYKLDKPIDWNNHATPLKREWIIRDVLASKVPGLLAAPLKCLKTTFALDLAISVVTKTPFLGFFPVEKPGRVVIFEGEVDDVTMAENTRRICRSRNVAVPSPSDLVVIPNPFPLGHPQREDLMSECMRRYQPLVAIIDTWTASRDRGAERRADSCDLSTTNPICQDIARACGEANCTSLIIDHLARHCRVATTKKVYTQNDLPFPGLAEAAGQWIVLTRRRSYQHNGIHELAALVEGRAGHQKIWLVRADEGLNGSQLTRWDIEVTPFKDAKEEPASETQAQPEEPKQQLSAADSNVLTAVREVPGGKSGWRMRAEVQRRLGGMSGSALTASLQRLKAAKMIDLDKKGRNHRVKLLAEA